MNISMITRAAGRGLLFLKKIAPELMLGGGIAAVVGGSAWACAKASTEGHDIIEETHELLDEIEAAREENRSPEVAVRKEVFRVYREQTWKMVKTYIGPVAVEAAGIALIIGSHCVLNQRYLGATAAYKLVEEAYRAYRERVKEAVGEENEKDIYLGTHKDKNIQVVNNIDPNSGEPVISATEGVVLNPQYNCSPYAKFFDESSTAWSKDPEYNLMFLRHQQNFFNDRLQAKGHVFLNEVYDALGIPRTRAGAVVGWILDGTGDGYIDFGLNDVYLDRKRGEKVRDFVNGYERSILLDFNVDGVIYDKI